MIKNELQLKKIIKNILLKEDYQIADVIDVYSNDIDTAIDKKPPKEDEIKIAIRRNNVLLEIILALVGIPSKNFKNFYVVNKISIENDFQNEEAARKKDFTGIQKRIKTFTDSIKNTDSQEDFTGALDQLKKDLDDYSPKWTILQYFFLNINNLQDIKTFIDNIANKNDNWTTIKNKAGITLKTIQFLNDGSIDTKSLTDIINKGKLDDDDKKEILSKTVSSPSFMRGIKRGEWNWLTDTIDDTAKLFFPNLSSITTDIENWFDDIGRALGKDPDSDENWLISYISENPEVKKYLGDIENGNDVSQEDMEDLLEKLEDDAKGNKPKP